MNYQHRGYDLTAELGGNNRKAHTGAVERRLRTQYRAISEAIHAELSDVTMARVIARVQRSLGAIS